MKYKRVKAKYASKITRREFTVEVRKKTFECTNKRGKDKEKRDRKKRFLIFEQVKKNE